VNLVFVSRKARKDFRKGRGVVFLVFSS